MTTIKTIASDIADELRSNPKAWHRGGFSNSTGQFDVDAPDATAWCLSGHMKRRGVSLSGEEYHAFAIHCHGSVCAWNDVPGRTVDDVIALCEKVAAAA